MKSGQSFLVIGAFVVLSTLTLSVNATLINTSMTGLEMEATLDAVSIAQTMLDEVLTHEYDQRTTGGVRVYNAEDLTPNASLGTDGSGEKIAGDHGIDTSGIGSFESRAKFNDVDDYNGYVRKSWNSRFGWFKVTVAVSYVDEDNPGVVSTDRTFYKRVTVSVTQPNLVKDINNNVIPLVVQDLSVYRRYF